jgi:TRAP-type C4-dicarboxylate transport system substrate-binding protein
MNKDKWNALPPDIQKILEKVNEEWIVKQGSNWDEIDKGGKEFTLSKGNKIITLSQDEDWKWTKLVRPLYDEYVQNMNAKGLPGQEALKFSLERIYQLQK